MADTFLWLLNYGRYVHVYVFFVAYFSFAPVVSASIHRYVNYFDIQVLMMVTETETLTSTLHHNKFSHLDYVFLLPLYCRILIHIYFQIYIYIYIYVCVCVCVCVCEPKGKHKVLSSKDKQQSHVTGIFIRLYIEKNGASLKNDKKDHVQKFFFRKKPWRRCMKRNLKTTSYPIHYT